MTTTTTNDPETILFINIFTLSLCSSGNHFFFCFRKKKFIITHPTLIIDRKLVEFCLPCILFDVGSPICVCLFVCLKKDRQTHWIRFRQLVTCVSFDIDITAEKNNRIFYTVVTNIVYYIYRIWWHYDVINVASEKEGKIVRMNEMGKMMMTTSSEDF